MLEQRVTVPAAVVPLAFLVVMLAALAPSATVPAIAAGLNAHVGGFALLAWLVGTVNRNGKTYLFGAFICIVAPITLEISQTVLTQDRVGSVTDALVSMSGATAGYAAATMRFKQGTLIPIGIALFVCILVSASIASARTWTSDVLVELAWQRAQEQRQVVAPWPSAPANAAYALTLSTTAEPIIVLDSGDRTALGLAPGLAREGREPGERGLSIIWGHRNKAFRALSDVAMGDAISLRTAEGIKLEYLVTELQVVRWNDSGLLPDVRGEELALVTCWPIEADYRSPFRYVVRAQRVADLPDLSS